MSRNQDRMGASQPDTSTPVQQQTQNTGGGFSFVVPTEFVDLPSRGLFYPVGHPLHNQDCVEIRHMTAKEEDILTSQTLLKKGVALDRLIRSVIVNKAIDPESLLVGDRNAIIIATRTSGYGNIYSTDITCPACSHTQKHSFDLNETKTYTGGDPESLEIVNNQNGTFNVTLPKTGVVATFKLLTGTDEKRIAKGVETDRKAKTHEKIVTRQLRSFLVGVNGDTSAQAINYVIDNVPSMDARYLRHAYKTTAPNVDLTQTFECVECSHTQDMEVPLTADFFWPDR